MSELERLSNGNAKLYSSLDFITMNFDPHQTARNEEVAALRQAEVIIYGAEVEKPVHGH